MKLAILVMCRSSYHSGAILTRLPQRRFAYEHPAYLHCNEEEDEDANNLPVSRTATPSVDTAAETTRPRKRRRTGANRTKPGEDFWSRVEQWFGQRRIEWGDKFSTDGWTS